MSASVAAYDLAPLVPMAIVGATIALGPLLWVSWKHRADPALRWRALTVLTLFLTFDLVLFGAFTRLTDSGLGCPDWPGCYGSVSPVGARAHIDAAQSAMPTGPVTHGKAWVEMVHRYFATGVGALITLLMLASWFVRSHGGALHRGWATLTFVWVLAQGAFGALTVTMKLYPAIVTMHLLLGLGLLVLLALQVERAAGRTLPLDRATHRAVVVLAVLAGLQVALGGWVSTNYAVLACRDFPTCQGAWWPDMDFEHGFALLRPLGAGRDGGYLPFAALTAIHVVHRLGALLVFAAIAVVATRLWRAQGAAHRRWALAMAGVAGWQLLSGLGNVVLGWPLLAAVAHTGGAAALVTLLATLLARASAPVHAGSRGAVPTARQRTA